MSGDILTADERGNLFFVDRTGDTFRWKGENCSTSEIEAQVSNEAGYRDSVVYGVEIVEDAIKDAIKGFTTQLKSLPFIKNKII